jgi:hypothetical protein
MDNTIDGRWKQPNMQSPKRSAFPNISPIGLSSINNDDIEPVPLLHSTMSDLEMRGVSDDMIFENVSLHEPFHPYPAFCENYAVEITIGLTVATLLVIAGQVIFDFVYLFRGENLLANS